ncbi:MAG TPA: putative Ig domain-containing protein [Terracidiphilus sp.]|nr:putative Ig domain-containing protein [Terracidiphilus sp.]
MARVSVLLRKINRVPAGRWAAYSFFAFALGTFGCFSGGHGGGGGGGGGGGTSGPLALPAASTLPAGCLATTVGATYTCQITASGGTANSSGQYVYTWQISGLPSGLSFSASTNTQTVTIAGTAQSQDLVGGRATTVTVTVKVSDSTGANVSITYSLVVNPGAAPLAMKTQSPLPYAYVGTAYSQLIEAQGGTTPYSFSLASGSSAPPGLTFTPGQAGTLAGTPTATGTYTFNLKVTDSSTPAQSVSQVFSLTVNQQISLNCSGVNLSLSLCGYYWFEMYGFNNSGGPTMLGGTFAANNTGGIVGGEVIASDSVAGVSNNTVTGSYTMDASGNGRGTLTLSDGNGTIGSFRFVAGDQALTPIEEFDSSGVRVEGQLMGPETAPVTPIPGNTILALPLIGANGSGQKTGLLGLFLVGTNGCDGSSGSLTSYEPFVTNTAGAVGNNLTATGSCAAPDGNGVGTAQFTISGGTPFSDTTLHFTYVNLVVGGAYQGTLFLETDAIGGNQPLMLGYAMINTSFGLSFGGYCPCLFGEQGTTDGTVGKGIRVASITRFLSSGTTQTGTLTGVIDQNAAGTITSQGTWPFTSYSVDGNGAGTFTGTGQKPIHVILGGGQFWTLDESTQVRTGNFYTQNATTIYLNGTPYIYGDFAGARSTKGGGDILGVVIPSGMTAGNFTGSLDFINGTGSYPGTAVGGSYGAPTYTSLDSTTGRGTGVVTFTNGTISSSTNIVIYAFRRISFLTLDVQSTDPDVGFAR